MDKRTLYTSTALLILIILAGFSFWYLQLVKNEIALNEPVDITESTSFGTINTAPGSHTNIFSGTNDDTDNTHSGAGQSPTSTQQQATSTTTSTTTEPEVEKWELVQLYKNPVAGLRLVHNSDVQVVRTVERKTGNVFDIDPMGNVQRLSGTVYPYVERAYIAPSTHVLIQHNNNEMSKLLTLSDATSTEQVPTPLAFNGVAHLTSNTLYYTTINTQAHSMSLHKADYDSIYSATKLWQTPLTGWQLDFINDTRALLVQSASYNIPGYAYILSLNDGVQEQLIADKPGLIVAISPHMRYTLYSTHGADGNKVTLLNLQDGSETPFNIRTLAQKCAWGDDTHVYCAIPQNMPNNAHLPDAWYMGQMHFNDTLVRIDVTTGDALVLASKTGSDIVDISVSDDFIAFKDKTTQTLWGVRREGMVYNTLELDDNTTPTSTDNTTQ